MANRKERRALEANARRTAKRAPSPQDGIAQLEARLNRLPDCQSAARAIDAVATTGDAIGNGVRAVTAVATLIDQTLPGLFEQQPACKRGCSYCCSIRVDLSVAELARLVAFIRDRFTPAQVDALKERARDRGRTAHGTTPESYPAQACALLTHGECSVYEARPLACRAEHSFDVEACKTVYATRKDAPEPRSLRVMQTSSLMRATVEARVAHAGLKAGFYELQEALAIALDTQDAFERHLAGDDVFAPARTDEGILARILFGIGGGAQ